MKAIVRVVNNKKPHLELKKVPKPEIGSKEILVKVLAASLNQADKHMLKGIPSFMRKMGGIVEPEQGVLGSDMAGIVERVGEEVTQFAVGDEVFGGLSSAGWGAFAEYASCREEHITRKPSECSFEGAASLPMAAVTALQGLRDKGQIKAGQQVLINGASGGVGSYAIQIAKAFGAKVTAVCSTKKIVQARMLGADKAIDYSQQDFTRMTDKYDLIFDIIGNYSVFKLSKVIAMGGSYISCAFSFSALLFGWWYKLSKGQKLVNMMAKSSVPDLQFISKWVEEGKLKPVVQQTFSLDDVLEAMDKLEVGGLSGKLVVVI